MPSQSQKSQSSSSAVGFACDRCRERKIRCGRERPRCAECVRDGEDECIYSQVRRRINHLKLLFEHVGRLSDRLECIESAQSELLARTRQSSVSSGSVRNSPSRTTSLPILPQEARCAGDHESSSLTSYEPFVFSDEKRQISREYGRASLFSLCTGLRVRMEQQYAGLGEQSDSLADLLRSMCNSAGAMEYFVFSDSLVSDLGLPKRHALAAVESFIQHVDHTTDVFCRDNLRAKIQDIYTRESVERDESWSVCIRTVLLFAVDQDFTRKVAKDGFPSRPSRSGIIPSRILTRPTLVNIQTLLLMSVLVQHYDPFGWSEFLFNHACVLARTMGLQHTPLTALTSSVSSSESVERAKVLRALYCRDQALAAHRGCVPSLCTDGRNLAADMHTAADLQAPYAKQIQLAVMQDTIYRTSHIPVSQLDQVLRSVLKAGTSSDSDRADMDLAFVGLLLASQRASTSPFPTPMLDNARTGCCILLVALGHPNLHYCRQLDALLSWTPGEAAMRYSRQGPQIPEASRMAALDAFPTAAFFILYEAQTRDPASLADANLDFELLRDLAACYANCAAELQHNSYHGKVANIFEQLMHLLVRLSTLDLMSSDVYLGTSVATGMSASGSDTSTEAIDNLWINSGVNDLSAESACFSNLPSGMDANWTGWNDYVPAQGVEFPLL